MPLPAQNLLAGETSPYLLQHSANPVHWRPWSSAALQEASELRRPILLSVGYAACHWCHVMAHESFEDRATAAVMNRHFTNIKVDREERPDIDQIFMAALGAMGEQGGWPLTMFLTPDGRPFWGGTYFPPTGRYGRPGFTDVLNAIEKAWREQREKIDSSADALAAHVKERLTAAQPRGNLASDLLPSLAAGIYGMIDHRRGGLRGAPKFPNAPFMHTLWLSSLNDGPPAHRDAVIDSMKAMLRGGIYDHVGGGLARYSTDADWLIPHFEKMLYDNAQLVRLANWAYAETGDKLFRFRIEATVDWLLRDMRTDEVSFASSLDADSEGEEGLFYTWDTSELAEAGVDPAQFSKYYLLAKPDAWEGKPVVAQTEAQAAAEVADRDEAAAIRKKLLDRRNKRPQPGRDDKNLVDWNGLTIVALAEAGRALRRPDWIESAEQAFAAILSQAQPDGRLPHSFRGESRLFPAMSSDYAAMINAAVALYEATHDGTYVSHARRLFDLLEQWHLDEDGAGHFFTASDSDDVPTRIRGDVDEAVDSATGQIIEATVRLATVTGNPELHERAVCIAEHAIGRVAKQAYGQAGIINAAALALAPIKLIIVEDPAIPMLITVANRNPDPRRVDIVVPINSTSELAALPGTVMPDTKKPGAYLCTGLICLPPIDNPQTLEQALATGRV